MSEIVTALVIAAIIALPFGLSMASGSSAEPTGNQYYRGGKKIRRQTNKTRRKNP
jgi:ABC-type phosphate/phosphonate transport system permease subunit